MTTNELPAANGQQAPSTGPGGIPKAPPDIAPSVTIAPVTGRVVAGVPVTVTVVAEPGTHWVWVSADGEWDPEPKVTYTQTRISIDGFPVLTDPGSGGGTESVTFPGGTHTLVASAVTTTGTVISSAPMSVQVAVAGPPVFTVTAPANGTTVDLDEAGKDITVQLNTTPYQYFPLTVDVTSDDRRTTGTMGTTQYQTVIRLAPMPLGARTIS